MRRLQKKLARLVKPIERVGRLALQHLMALVLRAPPRTLSLPAAPRVLVVRLDQRVGNLLLLSPFLSSLQATLPTAKITLLGHQDTAHVLKHHPAISALEHYVKWQLFTRRGVFALLMRLRRARFDLAFDAGSFFGAAVTHPLIARLSGARFVVGPRRPPLSGIYHAAVPVLPEAAADIDQRLQLLDALPNPRVVRELAYADRRKLVELTRAHAGFVRDAAPRLPAKTIVLVVGGRLKERQLPPSAWAQAARLALSRGFSVSLLWGPGERDLALAFAALIPGSHVAPASSIEAAAALFSSVAGVAGHDTGTSHLAAAVGAPLFVAFVATEPERYGHQGERSVALDVRGMGDAVSRLVPAFKDWLAKLRVA